MKAKVAEIFRGAPSPPSPPTFRGLNPPPTSCQAPKTVRSTMYWSKEAVPLLPDPLL